MRRPWAGALPLMCAAPFIAAAENTLEEVVITARRYSESRLEVPLSITVVTSDSIGSGAVNDLLTLAATVPGMSFASLWGGSGAAPVLRGQSQPSAAGDNVGVFVDGVYQGSRSAVDVEMLDVERIEVVRGPQNALYGRSSFAGAINYISRSAGAPPAATFVADVGSDGYRGVQFSLGGGMVPEWRGRIAASLRALDGTERNAAAPGARLGGYDRRALAATLSSPGNAAWQMDLHLRYQSNEQDHPATAPLTYPQYNCGSRDPVSNAWSYYCGPVPVPSVFDVSPDIPASSGVVRQGALHLQFGQGALRLTSDTSGYSTDTSTLRDFDDSSAGEAYGVCTLGVNCSGPPGLPRLLTRQVRVNQVNRSSDSIREFTQEFRLSDLRSERLRWLLGVVGVSTRSTGVGANGAQRGDLAANEQLTALLPGSPLLVGPSSRLNSALVTNPSVQQVEQGRSETRTLTYALFGTVDYSLSPAVRVHAELRGTRERQELDAQLANFVPSFGRAIEPEVFQDWNPRVSIEWQAGGARWYASSAKGSRSGGINPIPGLLPEEQRYLPEYNWTTELGWRYQRATLAAEMTLFYIDWEHTQITGFSNTPGVANLITRNTAGITTRGLEAVVNWRPARGLAIRAGYSAVDPQFRAGSDDPSSSVWCGLGPGVVTSSFCIVGPPRNGGSAAIVVPWVDGNVPNRALTLSWQLGLDWQLPAYNAQGTWQLHADVNYQNRVFDRPINGASFGARTLADLRLDRTRGRWMAQLWLRNLTDTRYVRTMGSRGAVFYPTSPRPQDLFAGEGRRYGLTLRYSR